MEKDKGWGSDWVLDSGDEFWDSDDESLNSNVRESVDSDAIMAAEEPVNPNGILGFWEKSNAASPINDSIQNIGEGPHKADGETKKRECGLRISSNMGYESNLNLNSGILLGQK